MAMKFGLLFATGAYGSSQLCETDANYEPTAASITYCYQLYASDTDLTNADCGGGGSKVYTAKGYDLTGDGVPDPYCLYDNLNSVEECNAKFPVGSSTFSNGDLCSAKSSQWSYTDSADLETKCETSGSTFAQFASMCCSDGLSVCEQFASQLCQTDANYMPTAPATTYCYQYYGSDAILTSTGCGGQYVYTSQNIDVSGDGAADPYCLYYNKKTVEECSAKFPVGDSTFNPIGEMCSKSSSQWSYTDSADLATKCATTGSDFTRLASKCCSDGLSVCDPSPEASPPETDDKTKKKSSDGSFGGVSLVISLSILAGCILLIIICVFVAYKTKKTRQEETNVVPQVALAELAEIPNKKTQGPLHVAEKKTTSFESTF